MTDAGMCCTESEVGKTCTLGEYVVTVTSKGRLTLPAAVRRRSGIELGDRVVIVIEDQDSFRPRRLEHDAEEAMADHADEMLRRLRGKKR
jgi:AbrB family looped-hinge helix DNA binding protein